MKCSRFLLSASETTGLGSYTEMMKERFQPFLIRSVDQSFSYMSNLLRSPVYSKGWGDPQLLTHLQDLAKAAQASPLNYAERDSLISPHIRLHISQEKIEGKHRVITGKFKSNAASFLPEESKDCYFQLIAPKEQKGKLPLVISYAMTGDESFSLRKMMAHQLLEQHNIATISIMNPFYGERRPKEQNQSSLLHVSDIMAKGVALVSEGLSLIELCKEDTSSLGDFGPFGVTGISMGGHMASLAACNSGDPVAVTPCLSPYSAGPVFTKGLLSNWCAWEILDKELPSYVEEGETLTSKEYMATILDITTNITKFRSPVKKDAIIQVAGKFDCYVPGSGDVLHKHWKGSELRWIPHSHVSSIALGQKHFVQAIADSFKRL